MRLTVTFEIEVPEGASRHAIGRYIVTELKSAGGQFYPEDPLFGGLVVENFELKIKEN